MALPAMFKSEYVLSKYPYSFYHAQACSTIASMMSKYTIAAIWWFALKYKKTSTKKQWDKYVPKRLSPFNVNIKW